MRGPVFLLWISLMLSAGFSHGEVKWTHYFSSNDIMDMADRGDTLWCFNSESVVSWNTHEKCYSQIQFPFFSSQFSNSPFISVGPDGSAWLVKMYRAVYTDSSFTAVQLNRYSGGQWTESGAFHLDATDDTLNSFFCDRKGNVWLGTNQSGALKFDGISWVRYSGTAVPMTSVRTMAVDDSGSVWMGTDDGLYRFFNGNWRRFSTRDGLAGNLIRCLLIAPDGALWVGTGTGASRFNGADWKTYTIEDGLSSNGINAMTVDRAGKIWLGTDNGVSCFDGAAWSAWKGNTDYFIDQKVTGIAADATNRIWMSHRGAGKGVTVFDGSQLKWYTTLNTDIPTDNIESVAAGSDGVLWFATGKGAIRYDGTAWKSYTTGDGLASNNVKTVMVDRNNSVWILYSQSENAGITHLDADGPSTFTSADGLPDNTILSVAVSGDGAVWFGTRGGVTRFDGRSWESFPDSNHLISSRITGIAEDPDGVLWFSTGMGLARFDGTNWRTYIVEKDIFNGTVSALSPSPDGTVWCIVNNKLLHFENGVFTTIPDPGGDSKLTMIAVDHDGVVWTDAGINGIDERKVFCFDGAGWNMIGVSWTGAEITEIIVDENNVKWFATDKGLIRMESDSSTIWRENCFDGHGYKKITIDRNNTVWFYEDIDTNNTLGFDGKEWEIIPYYGSAIVVDSRNVKWMHSDKGLLSFDGSKWETWIPPLPYRIIGNLAVDNRDAVWFTVYHDMDKQYQLACIDGREWKMYGSGGTNLNSMRKMVIDNAGVKWLTGNKEIVSYNGGEWKTYPDAPVTTDISWYDIAVDQDNIKWFGTSEGILSFDGSSWTKYTEKDGYPGKWVMNVVVDRFNIKWFNCGSIVSFDGSVWKKHTIDPGETNIWISSSTISAIGVDMDNRKWFVWRNGVGGYAVSVLDDRPGADTGNIPFSFSLLGNYPNPFNAGTSIAFETSVRGAASLSVYDILGRKVREVNEGKLPVGRNAITWNGADDHGKRVSSGVYLYRVQFGDAEKTGRMLFLK